MNFGGQSASGAKDICCFCAKMYAEEVCVSSNPDLATEEVPFDSLHFTVTKAESAMLDLADDKVLAVCFHLF
jgi:hypothetical protein